MHKGRPAEPIARRSKLRPAPAPSLLERSLSAAGFLAVAAGAVTYRFMASKPHPVSPPPTSSSPTPSSSPTHIPARGWRHIAARTWSEFNADQIPQAAGGVAFFALLSIFPAMAAFVSLYGLFADASQVPSHLAVLGGLLPHAALELVADEMTRIATAKHAPLGVAFAISLLLSIWSANGAVKALFSGLNTAYECKERRGIVWLNLIALGFTLGALTLVLISLGLIVSGPVLLRGLGWPGSINPVLISLLRWPVMAVITMGSLAMLYRFGPSKPREHWRWITPGSLFASVGWLLVSMGFSWYVANFGHYDKTYGSLGAVVGFMTWLWLSTIVILAGAELNSEIEAEAGAAPTSPTPPPAAPAAPPGRRR